MWVWTVSMLPVRAVRAMQNPDEAERSDVIVRARKQPAIYVGVGFFFLHHFLCSHTGAALTHRHRLYIPTFALNVQHTVAAARRFKRAHTATPM